MKDSQTLRTQFKVSDFVAWQRDGALELNPNFQRRPVWKKGAKSYLIDTILRDLPMPIIFLRDKLADIRTLKSARDVVDGQQRIRTILSFIDPSLLSDYDPERDHFVLEEAHNKDLAGKSFQQLPLRDQQRILDYQFSVHAFPADTDDREILQIFARMNSTGVNLNAQELRNAEFFGSFKTAAYELATEQLPRWREWRIFTPDQIARMNEVEITSEFMILIMSGILEKNNSIINAFYRGYDESFPDWKEVGTRFRTTLDGIGTLLSLDVIHRFFRSRTMFYALFATVHGWQYSLQPPPSLTEPTKDLKRLARQKPKPMRKDLSLQLVQGAASIKNETAPADVLKSSRGSTAHAGQRRTIIGHLAGKGNNPCPPIR
jgi:hypothetical protein